MRSDLAERYKIGEPSYETEFIVYPADDKRLQRQVFIVVPDISLKSDKARLERVWASVNAAKAMPALRFTEIVDLIPATAEDTNFYIVERRLPKTLRAFLDEQEVVAFDSAVEIVRQVLEGLATLHGAGYAHNALTDTCLYISDDYSGLAAKIGNLHLISPVGERIVPPYAPEFGPPEIYASGTFTASPAVDVYSLGMIAYKLFLPRRAYAEIFQTALIWDDEHNREQSWKNIHLDPAITFPRLDTLNPGFPEKVAALVERMLARDPAVRPRDGVEALEEFRRATMGSGGYRPPSDPGPAVREPPVKTPTKKRWGPVKIAVVALIAAVWIGAAAVTVPMLLGPDPELVKQVELAKSQAETRRQSAVAAKAPERPQTDEAGKAYAAGVRDFDASVAAVTDSDYEKALAGFKASSASFDRAVVDIARDAAAQAQKAAEEAGGAQAPAFKEAAQTMTKAGEEAAANKAEAAVNTYAASSASFTALSTALKSLAEAKRQAEDGKKAAAAIGGEDEEGFAGADAKLTAAGEAGGRFEFEPATKDYAAAGAGFGAVIDAINGAKPDAEKLRASAFDLSKSLAERAGAQAPEVAAFAPRLAEAEGVFSAKAYKRAIAAFQPLVADMQALSDRGFCPTVEAAFLRVEAGNYKADNIRLMTGSLSELGGMLGMASGEIRLEKPFCLKAEAVTRGEIAAFYAARGDDDSAGLYRSNPESPAEDVPQPAAEDYARWYSETSGMAFRLPSAQEWITGSPKASPLPTDGVVLQWSATPCQGGGHLAFLAQEGMSFAVCSDDGTGGFVRLAADVR